MQSVFLILLFVTLPPLEWTAPTGQQTVRRANMSDMACLAARPAQAVDRAASGPSVWETCHAIC